MTKAAPTEVERKFLVAEGWKPESAPVLITQGYITLDGTAAHLTSRNGVAQLNLDYRLPNRTSASMTVPVLGNELDRLASYADPKANHRMPIATGFEARVRIKRGGTVQGSPMSATFTMKSKKAADASSRTEIEMAIDPGVAAAIERTYSIGTLRKYRYTEPLVDSNGERVEVDGQNLLVEVDRYSHELYPLRVAEIEFPEGAGTELPLERLPFLGLEVTNDARFSNAQLATKGLPGFEISPGTPLRGHVLPGLG